MWSASVYGRMFGYPRSAGPDTLEHSQGRDGVRCSKAVPSQCRRCNCFSSRHPQQHRSLPEDAAIRLYATGLCLRVGLYLAPSDMTLHPGNVQGYNNEIMIAGSEAAFGHNLGINELEQIGKTTGDKSFEGKFAAPAGTDHKGPPSGRPTGPPTPAAVAPQQHASATSHEEEKTALIASGVRVGLVALWLSLR